MKIWLILLAIWLIMFGAVGVFHLTFEAMPVIMGILAIASGVLMFMSK